MLRRVMVPGRGLMYIQTESHPQSLSLDMGLEGWASFRNAVFNKPVKQISKVVSRASGALTKAAGDVGTFAVKAVTAPITLIAKGYEATGLPGSHKITAPIFGVLHAVQQAPKTVAQSIETFAKTPFAVARNITDPEQAAKELLYGVTAPITGGFKVGANIIGGAVTPLISPLFKQPSAPSGALITDTAGGGSAYGAYNYGDSGQSSVYVGGGVPGSEGAAPSSGSAILPLLLGAVVLSQ